MFSLYFLTDYLKAGLALVPAVALLYYIYRQDRLQQEPWRQLLKGVLFGFVSAILAMLIALPASIILESVPGLQSTVTGCVLTAFGGAAIPEESAKLFMLWVLLRANRYFDERFDGIVYAVCVGLGFAAFENVLYVFSGESDWMRVAFVRSIFSVPGHFFFAVFMGYFYSLVHFHRATSQAQHLRNQVCVWTVPVLFHGLFDAFLFISDIRGNDALAGGAFLAFLALYATMLVLGILAIRRIIRIDEMYLQLHESFAADAERYDAEG